MAFFGFLVIGLYFSDTISRGSATTPSMELAVSPYLKTMYG
jgi:hypothetical protein